MTRTTFDIKLPTATTKDEAKLLLSIKLYEAGKTTLGQAAKIEGYSQRAFLEVLEHQEIPVFNYTAENLREEMGL